MIYIDENGNQIETPDLTKGYLVDAEWVEHPETAQQGHIEYEPLEGGGRLQRYVVDVPYQAAWTEVTAQRYIPYTEEELELMAKADHAGRLDALEMETAEQRSALEAIVQGVAQA